MHYGPMPIARACIGNQGVLQCARQVDRPRHGSSGWGIDGAHRALDREYADGCTSDNVPGISRDGMSMYGRGESALGTGGEDWARSGCAKMGSMRLSPMITASMPLLALGYHEVERRSCSERGWDNRATPQCPLPIPHVMFSLLHVLFARSCTPCARASGGRGCSAAGTQFQTERSIRGILLGTRST